jgi:hypothetical protein
MAGGSDWGLVSEDVHSLDHVVKPSGTVIECEDCHWPDGGFDWAAAGYSDAETEHLIWSEYPPIEAIEATDAPPSAAPYWVLGLGVVMAAGVMMPLVRRGSRRER